MAFPRGDAPINDHLAHADVAYVGLPRDERTGVFTLATNAVPASTFNILARRRKRTVAGPDAEKRFDRGGRLTTEGSSGSSSAGFRQHVRIDGEETAHLDFSPACTCDWRCSVGVEPAAGDSIDDRGH